MLPSKAPGWSVHMRLSKKVLNDNTLTYNAETLMTTEKKDLQETKESIINLV
jgi:hypothetical protein